MKPICLDRMTMARLIGFCKAICNGNIRFKSSAAILQVHNIERCLRKLSQLSLSKPDRKKAADLLYTSLPHLGKSPHHILKEVKPDIINKQRPKSTHVSPGCIRILKRT